MCRKIEMKLKIYAALSEDINNGWVWLPESIVAARNVVKISNPSSRKKIYCEALSIGPNFKKRYDQKAGCQIEDPSCAIIINEWYRHKLGIFETQAIEDLDISTFDNILGKIWASLDHPQNVVRLASLLGILSAFLGIVGIWLAIKGQN